MHRFALPRELARISKRMFYKENRIFAAPGSRNWPPPRRLAVHVQRLELSVELTKNDWKRVPTVASSLFRQLKDLRLVFYYARREAMTELQDFLKDTAVQDRGDDVLRFSKENCKLSVDFAGRCYFVVKEKLFNHFTEKELQTELDDMEQLVRSKILIVPAKVAKKKERPVPRSRIVVVPSEEAKKAERPVFDELRECTWMFQADSLF